MPYDKTCLLWPRIDRQFFAERSFRMAKQEGPSGVPAVLAMLTGVPPSLFQGKVNTQDPTSWSEALGPWGMALSYCPTDMRKVRFYIDELIALDDLFTISYYTSRNNAELFADPDPGGWVTDAHMVLLHRDKVLDPLLDSPCDARSHKFMDLHTKRIFRVVPLEYPRRI